MADVSSATTGHLRYATWYQEQLSNPDASINIKKTKSINERARREHSLTWVNMLDEIEEDPTESIWVIETPPKELLVCFVLCIVMLS